MPEPLPSEELPHGFVYPEAFRRIDAADVVAPWWLLEGEHVLRRQRGLAARYPEGYDRQERSAVLGIHRRFWRYEAADVALPEFVFATTHCLRCLAVGHKAGDSASNPRNDADTGADQCRPQGQPDVLKHCDQALKAKIFG